MNEHDHTHHSFVRANENRLLIALAITGLMAVVELVGGLLSNSLALLGDAAHMFTDTMALGLSLFALNLAKRPASESKTFGYLRAEILAALINGMILILVTVFIFYEAYQRALDPPEVHGSLMLIVAAIGLVANLIGISVLYSGSRQNLNVKGAFLHMWGDAISSVGVIVAGIIILLTGWNIADPILSILIGIIILRGAIRLVWESVNILLEAVPKDLDIGQIIGEIKSIDGLRDVHDIHVWTITSGVYALSAHLLIEDQLLSRTAEISERIDHVLSQKFGIGHSTLQFECEECQNNLACHFGGESK
ncbi:MAG: cation diffusion facilitator family transporter [Dehalococcoidia bacterium]